MRYLMLLVTVAGALVACAVASAGGWATVGVEPMPTGIGPGEPWNPKLTILQHGRTPLTGLSPTVTITRDGTGESRRFTARETNEPGVYEARVVFPEAGSWRVVADSTFGDSRLTFGPVTIEQPGGSAGGSGDEFPMLPLVAVLAGLGAVAAAALGALRQRRLTPAR